MNPILARSFQLASGATLLAWLPLFLAPAWTVGHLGFWSVYIGLLCALYGYFLFVGRRHDRPGETPRGHFRSLAGVLGLFRSPRAVLAGWLHYLAFDLMVGLYIVQDSQALALSHWLVAPCLVLALMFGPLGLLGYWLLRLTLG